jgi:hypothetical protein
MRLSHAEARKLGIDLDAEPVPKGKASPRSNDMNRTERAYAQHLEALKRAGEIVRWDREPEGLRLADRCVFWPDFRVVRPDLAVEMHEIKGRSGRAFYAKEDAWIKLKVAAQMHPYRFFVIWPRQGGGWETKEV